MSEKHALGFCVVLLAITFFSTGYMKSGIYGGILWTVISFFTLFGLLGTLFFLESL